MKKNLLLSLSSGLLLWAAWPPTPYSTVLLFVALVPMLLAVENLINSSYRNKGKKIFSVTFLGFFVWNTLCIYWVYNSLKTIGPIVALPISLIPYSLGPLLMAAAWWFYYRLRLTASRGFSLAALVCFWIAYEYLHQTWELAFPWMTLGNGFAVSHQWIQWYEYTGVYGGTVWIWLSNIFFFLIYAGLQEAQKKTTRIGLIAGVILTLTLPIGFSWYKYSTYEEQKDPSNIVVVQPNVDPYAKEFSIPVYQQIKTLTHLSDSLGQPDTEFFIWPETAIPDQNLVENNILTNPDIQQVQSFLHKYKNGNLITGAETFKIYNSAETATAQPMNGGQYADAFNAALSIENSSNIQFYHKSKLVPGAEMIPFSALSFLKPAFEHLGGATGSYGRQAEAGVFYTQSGIGVDPVICYESIWGEYIAESVKKGAQFIAIITNDGWWENTSGKDQHLDYAKLRAIETRRWVCRSANTGISAFINERGDIVQRTGWWVKTAIKQNINLNSDITFYVQHGDYIAHTGSLLAVLGMVWVLVRFRIKPKPKVA